MTFIRYCTDPLIAMLNPAMEGTMEILYLDEATSTRSGSFQGESIVVSSDTEYLLQFSDGIPLLGGLQRWSGKHLLNLTFDPPFPNLVHMEKTDAKAEGSFTIAGDPSTGSVHGNYVVITTGGYTEIELLPSGGWSPAPDRFSLRFLYRVAGVFRKWPETYRWTATINRDHPEQWHMQSHWERTEF